MNLELKNLAPYLPYSLKVESQKGNGDLDYKGLKKEMTCFNIHKIDGDKWKPLLIPLSELNKQIESEIPLIALAEISQYKDRNPKFCGKWEIEKISGFAQMDLGYGIQSFHVNYNKKGIISINVTVNGKFTQTTNINEIYEYLFSKHFDVFGLIDQGLAVPLISAYNGSNYQKAGFTKLFTVRLV